jgi:hypothetical protein
MERFADPERAIAFLLSRGWGVQDVARAVPCNPSTIWRARHKVNTPSQYLREKLQALAVKQSRKDTQRKKRNARANR